MLPRILPALILAVSLLTPVSVLAADPATVSWQNYEITGLVLGSEPVTGAGKISFASNGTFAATVGCNTIGGDARPRSDGGGYEISGVLSTMMACEESLMAVEGALMKILSAGSLSLADGAFGNDVGRIEVRDAGTTLVTDDPIAIDPPVTVIDPAPEASATTGPIMVGPTFDITQCMGVLSDEELAPYLGRTVEGTISVESGASGSGSAGNGGTGGEPAPSAAVEPMPPVIAEPMPDLAPLPGTLEPGVVLPAPGIPGVAPTAEECRNLLASLRTVAGGLDAMPPLMAAGAAADANTQTKESAALEDQEDDAGLLVGLGAGLLGGLIAGVALALFLVRRRGGPAGE